MNRKSNFINMVIALSLLALGSVSAANAALYEAEAHNGMFGLQYETTNDVSGGQNAGWIDEGDWVQWNINVAQAGNYTLMTRSATITPARVEVYIDGNYVAELGLSSTNSWTIWKSFTSSVFPIASGNHTLRVRFATGGQNLNWVSLNQTTAVNQAEAFNIGLWRLVSRMDRTTLSKSLFGTDYVSQPHQHWRLINRGSNTYDLQLEATQTCLARIDRIAAIAAAGLADCNTANSSWVLEMLRKRSVDRPAIYRLKSPQNTCLIPPTNPFAKATIGSCTTTNTRWYLEAVGYGERPAPSQYEVKGLLIVKPITGVVDPAHGLQAQGTVAQSIVEASQISFKTGVKSWLERITDGRVTWVASSVVANEPIRSFSYDTYSNTWWQNPVTRQNMVWNFTAERFEAAPSDFNSVNYQWTNFLPAAVNLPNDVQRFVPRGAYDTVQVLFTGGTVPGGWGWGPGRSPQSNYALWTTINGGQTSASEWLSSNSEPTEVFIHEMMHGFDTHFDQQGLPLPEGYLHGTGANRYGGNSGWTHWYRDYWLGTVIASDDTYRGYGPRMFSKQTLRQYALAQPESTIKIVHSTSGKCLSTENGVTTNPAPDTKVVFSSSCNTSASSFVLQSNGMLRHKPSGYCVHPLGGTPFSGVVLVLWPSCTGHQNLLVDINDDGNIRNSLSGFCVHPEGGSPTPVEGTKAVYHRVCNEERLRFTFNRY